MTVLFERLHNAPFIDSAYVLSFCWEGAYLRIYQQDVTNAESPGGRKLISYGKWDCKSEDEYDSNVGRYLSVSKHQVCLGDLLYNYDYWDDELDAIDMIKQRVWASQVCVCVSALVKTCGCLCKK